MELVDTTPTTYHAYNALLARSSTRLASQFGELDCALSRFATGMPGPHMDLHPGTDSVPFAATALGLELGHHRSDDS